MFRDCAVLPFIIRHQRKTHKRTHPHTSYGLHFYVFLYPSSRKKKKEDKRIESGLKWKLEGPRESQSETHINIHTHIEESAVSRMDLSWGEYTALMPSLWSEAQAVCTGPREGHVYIPPIGWLKAAVRAEHTTQRKEWSFLTVLLSLHTLSSPTPEWFCWERERPLRAVKLTILDLMSAMF